MAILWLKEPSLREGDILFSPTLPNPLVQSPALAGSFESAPLQPAFGGGDWPSLPKDSGATKTWQLSPRAIPGRWWFSLEGVGPRAPLSLRVTSPILRSILGTPTKTAVLVLNAPSRPLG